MRDEGLDAVVVEADRVEHAGRRFDRPPGRVAGPRLLRDRLGKNAAEPAEIDQACHLAGVAEGARGDEDRIGQRSRPSWTARSIVGGAVGIAK